MAEAAQGGCEAFARLTAILPTSPQLLTDDQLVEYAGAVEAAGRFLDGLKLGVAREFDHRSDETFGEDSLARKLGAKKPWGALEIVTRTSAKDAHGRVAEVRRLAKLPAFEQAVEQGVLGREQAAAIIDPLVRSAADADPHLLEAACDNLLDLSAVLPATAVAEAAQAWALVLDPDGIEPVEKAAVEKRFFRLGRARDGLVKVTGLLPVEQAAAIRAVFDAYLNPRAGASVSFTPGELADDELRELAADDTKPTMVAIETEPPTDTRSPDQKRADILHAVFSAHARSAEVPTLGGAHPTILVTVRKEDLASGHGAATVDGEDQPISARSAKRIAETGGYQEVELGDNGEILKLGRTQRIFTPQQRRALAARDKGCVIPGCTMPARLCEAHHIPDYQHGGQTDIDHGTLLCWWHHYSIDTGPYQLRITNGIPEVRWVFGSHASPWVPAVHQPEHDLTRAA